MVQFNNSKIKVVKYNIKNSKFKSKTYVALIIITIYKYMKICLQYSCNISKIIQNFIYYLNIYLLTYTFT